MEKNIDQTYHAYLLRLWREEHGGKFVWRASLEIPGADKRRAFADLAALFAFLQEQTHVNSPAATQNQEPA